MKKFKVGLQLYSIKDAMQQDMDAALKAVKEMGYDYVEFAGYYDHTAEEVRAMLDKYGLKCISVHQSYGLFLSDSTAVDFLKTIGAEYAAIPWLGVEHHKGSADYEETLADIKKASKLLSDKGITMLYHNHDFEFGKYEDKYLEEWFLEDMGGAILPEFDVCWVRYSDIDPAEYIKGFKGQVPVLHLKDFVCKSFAQGPAYDLIDSTGKDSGKKPTKEENGFKFRPLGQGLQDFEKILAAAEEIGTEYVIVEQDSFDGIEPLEGVKQSREYLKKLGL